MGRGTAAAGRCRVEPPNTVHFDLGYKEKGALGWGSGQPGCRVGCGDSQDSQKKKGAKGCRVLLSKQPECALGLVFKNAAGAFGFVIETRVRLVCCGRLKRAAAATTGWVWWAAAAIGCVWFWDYSTKGCCFGGLPPPWGCRVGCQQPGTAEGVCLDGLTAGMVVGFGFIWFGF
ncbi:hypothetical protein Tco_0182600 [Tanacetum coccineum]